MARGAEARPLIIISCGHRCGLHYLGHEGMLGSRDTRKGRVLIMRGEQSSDSNLRDDIGEDAEAVEVARVLTEAAGISCSMWNRPSDTEDEPVCRSEAERDREREYEAPSCRSLTQKSARWSCCSNESRQRHTSGRDTQARHCRRKEFEQQEPTRARDCPR